ncbi:MAG: 8-amino-7-oxononanoate synthase [Lutibacter sp.]|nr:MAG: 8-amino-7-oxononanoate synthase [Lutibacter sp.]
MKFPKKLHKKLTERKEKSALRTLSLQTDLIDFSSNDYLGLSKSKAIFQKTHQYLIDTNLQQNGATGSRLLSGNHQLYEDVESQLCDFYNSESATIFNSGYDANIGFFSSVPQRGDIILYDTLIHASIRDGIRLSNAKSYSFKHNDLEDLSKKILRFTQNDSNIYVVTESVFSMDGDSPDLAKMSQILKKNNAHLIVDEAHAVGVFGKNGCGLIQELGIESEVFARIITFGKALGCHGAVILGTKELKEYLVNFSRSLIYTTALPPHSLATIKMAYEQLVILNDSEESPIKILHQNIQYFKSVIKKYNFQEKFIESSSSIQCCIISGNENVKKVAASIREKGFDVKPILSPTVSQGEERLRFCLHSYNSEKEIDKVLKLLATFV